MSFTVTFGDDKSIVCRSEDAKSDDKQPNPFLQKYEKT